MYTKVVILEGLDIRFEDRKHLFQKEFEYLFDPKEAFGILITAIPQKCEVRFDRVFHSGSVTPELDEDWHQVYRLRNDKKPERLATVLDNPTLQWRPKPRVARADSDSYFWRRYFAHKAAKPMTNFYKEIHCDGLIELGLVASRFHGGNNREYVSPYLPPVLFANMIAHAHRVRTQAGRPLTPYDVEVSIHVKGSTRIMGHPGTGYDPLGYIKPGLIVFPRYELNTTKDFLATLNLFHLDLYHSLGQDLNTDQSPLSIENWPNIEQHEIETK